MGIVPRDQQGPVKWHPRGEIPSTDLGTGSSHLPLHCDLPGPSAIHPALTNPSLRQKQSNLDGNRPPFSIPLLPEPLKAKSPHRPEMTPQLACRDATWGRSVTCCKPSRLICIAFLLLASFCRCC